jgi:hypothetical protein
MSFEHRLRTIRRRAARQARARKQTREDYIKAVALAAACGDLELFDRSTLREFLSVVIAATRGTKKQKDREIGDRNMQGRNIFGVVVLICALLLAMSASAEGQRQQTNAAKQMGRAAVHLAYGVPWFAAKLAGAGVVGVGASSLAWALSKGDTDTFKSIAVPWTRGTWLAPWPLFQDGVSFLGERPASNRAAKPLPELDEGSIAENETGRIGDTPPSASFGLSL